MQQKDSEMLVKFLAGVLIGMIGWIGIMFYTKLTKIENTLNQLTQVTHKIGNKVGVDVEIITAASIPKRPIKETIRTMAILPEPIKISK
jgi:hypothetical protein